MAGKMLSYRRYDDPVQISEYVVSRPRYPQKVFDMILEYTKQQVCGKVLTITFFCSTILALEYCILI